MDTVGLQVTEGVRVNRDEETGWMNAARGSSGTTGGPISHQYISNAPGDKVSKQHVSVWADQADTGWRDFV